MPTMYTVLMPVDGDEGRVTAQAAMVAELPAADQEVKVVMLFVFDDRERAEVTTPSQVGANADAIDLLEDLGIEIEQLSRHGNPVAEIIVAAEEVAADLIVMGGRKRSPLGSALFGSVSQDVLLEADRPVVITGAVEPTADPSHRCQSCGEEYFTDPDVEISTCRSCGGTKVERVR
ncbi:MAG: universal stress protein [Halorhabdus sp.]